MSDSKLGKIPRQLVREHLAQYERVGFSGGVHPGHRVTVPEYLFERPVHSPRPRSVRAEDRAVYVE